MTSPLLIGVIVGSDYGQVNFKVAYIPPWPGIYLLPLCLILPSLHLSYPRGHITVHVHIVNHIYYSTKCMANHILLPKIYSQPYITSQDIWSTIHITLQTVWPTIPYFPRSMAKRILLP